MENEIEKLQSILQADPSNFQARRELSIILADKGFIEEALGNLQYLVKYFPEDAEIHYNIGILYEKLKDFTSAQKAYKKAIKISPQDDFYYNLGEVFVELQKWDEAIEAFKTVLKNDSKDGNCYFNLGLCYMKKDENNLAVDNFQQAVTLNPKDLYAHFYLGNIYQNNGLTNFATESYKKVLDISPDYSWAYYNLASISYKNGNIEEAKDYLLKTIQYNKQDVEAYKLLVKIYLNQNEADQAMDLVQRYLASDENGDIYYLLARIYKYMGDAKRYAETMEQVYNCHSSLTYPFDMIKKEMVYAFDCMEKNIETNNIEEYNNEISEGENLKFNQEDFIPEEQKITEEN